jgi:hypothetical protein
MFVMVRCMLQVEQTHRDDVTRRNHDIPAAGACIPLEYRTANELRSMAELLRTTADANTHSMQAWTELLALAAYCDDLADQVANFNVSENGMREVRSGALSSQDAPDARWQGQYRNPRPDRPPLIQEIGFDPNQKVTYAGLPARLPGGRHLRSTRFLPLSGKVAAETKASQEVIDLVRLHRELGLLVIQLRDAGRPWSEVKVLIEDEIGSALDDATPQ